MGESNSSKLNTVLLVVVIVLLLWDLLSKPQSQPIGRFQKLDDAATAVLDTKTGQICRTFGQPMKDVPPLCSELK